MEELRRRAILHERQGWFHAGDVLAKAKAEAYLDAVEVVQTCFAGLDQAPQEGSDGLGS
jgi:hypothetical protein